MRALLIGTVLWLLCATGAPAAAQPKPKPADPDVIGLLDVRVEGVSDTGAEVFAQQIEESLGIAGLQVAPRARLREHLAGTSWNAACLVGACLRELKTHAGVATVIEAALVQIGPSYHYVITLIDTQSGAILHQLARTCDVCTTDEAFSSAALDVVELIQQRDGDRRPAPARPAPPPPGRAKVRKAAWFLLGAAVAAGAGGVYLMSRDEDRAGAAALGGAGAFAVAGATCLGVSFSF